MSKHCFACGADGRSFVQLVYGHVITEFSGMGRFTYPWCSAGARFARARAPLKNLQKDLSHSVTDRYLNGEFFSCIDISEILLLH